jgi:hypothetical protein
MKTKTNSILTSALAVIMLLGTAKTQAALTITWGAQTDDSFVLAASTIPTRIDVPLNSAAVAGVFSSAVSKSTFSAYKTASEFLTGFTQLASSTIGNGTSMAGTFGGGGTIATGTDTYVGKQLYYIIGNASTIATSTQLGVFTKSTWVIPTNPTGPTPTSFVTDINQVTNDTSSILFGGYLAGGGMTISGSTRADAYQLNLIPEPSSASLLALGVAGLVALRARRKI